MEIKPSDQDSIKEQVCNNNCVKLTDQDSKDFSKEQVCKNKCVKPAFQDTMKISIAKQPICKNRTDQDVKKNVVCTKDANKPIICKNLGVKGVKKIAAKKDACKKEIDKASAKKETPKKLPKIKENTSEGLKPQKLNQSDPNIFRRKWVPTEPLQPVTETELQNVFASIHYRRRHSCGPKKPFCSPIKSDIFLPKPLPKEEKAAKQQPPSMEPGSTEAKLILNEKKDNMYPISTLLPTSLNFPAAVNAAEQRSRTFMHESVYDTRIISSYVMFITWFLSYIGSFEMFLVSVREKIIADIFFNEPRCYGFFMQVWMLIVLFLATILYLIIFGINFGLDNLFKFPIYLIEKIH